MRVKVNSVAASTLLYFFMISNISCLERYHFSQQNMNSFYYKEMLKTFISQTTHSCIYECISMVKPCTHVVLKNVDHGMHECSLFDARNGTQEFFLDGVGGVGHELWTNAGFIRGMSVLSNVLFMSLSPFCVEWSLQK